MKRTQYINGLKHGIEEIYYENRNLKFRISYKNGQLNGIHEIYNMNNMLI